MNTDGPPSGTALLEAEGQEGDELLVATQAPLEADELRRLLELQQSLRQAVAEMAKVIRGQENLLWLLVAVIAARGHVLLTAVPGLAKTLAARALTKALGFANQMVRIQFTVDTRPTDLIGFLYPDPETHRLTFQVGGMVFCHVVLADEVNRTPAATQGALLEAMAERQVTVTAGPEQTTHRLKEPFFVIATQNPIEQEGTFPLPEAQLDRFLASVMVDYPAEVDEEQVIGDDALTTGAALDRVRAVVPEGGLQELQALLTRGVKIPSAVANYIVRLVQATRPATANFASRVKVPVPRRAGETSDPKPLPLAQVIRLGGSPRASQAVRALARAYALLNRTGEGVRRTVSCQDVKDAFIACLRHRLILTPEAIAEGITAEAVLTCIMAHVPIERQATTTTATRRRAPLLLRPFVAVVRYLASKVEGW